MKPSLSDLKAKRIKRNENETLKKSLSTSFKDQKGKKQKSGSGHIVNKSATSFKANKASGDLHKKGTSVQPYAYIQLNPAMKKEKWKRKSMQTFDDNLNIKRKQKRKKQQRVSQCRC